MMALKKFMADIASAHQKCLEGLLPGVTSIDQGDSDGEVVITFPHLRIRAVVEGDIRDYPDATTFMFFTDTNDPSQAVLQLLNGFGDSVIAHRVTEMVTALIKALNNPWAGTSDHSQSDEDGEKIDEGEDEVNEDYDHSDYEEYDDTDVFGLGGPERAAELPFGADGTRLSPRVKQDLRKVREAGYKVSILDGMGAQAIGIISISIRIDKLGLTEEALEAWDMRTDDYVVLLVRVSAPYKPLEEIFQVPASNYPVAFAVGKCERYKPSLDSALAAFSGAQHSHGSVEKDSEAAIAAEFHKIFISNSLDQFMNEAFLSLLKLRGTGPISWDAANEILISRIGLIDPQGAGTKPGGLEIADVAETGLPEDNGGAQNHETLITDHLRDAHGGNVGSFPLVAMQFAMRYFIRCTEFCLRCHRRLPSEFESLRPYVCDNPLCLFQYMAMGFGPSIEHEILTEPYVVDLLVSLCYASIQTLDVNIYANTPTSSFPIRTFPVGLRFQVPNLVKTDPGEPPIKAAITRTQDSATLSFAENADQFNDRLMPGTWVAFRYGVESAMLVHHGVVTSTDSCLKTVELRITGMSGAYVSGTVRPAYAGPYGPPPTTPGPPPGMAGQDSAFIYFYDVDFDSLPDAEKALAMRHVLDTLPPILEIEEYLNTHLHKPLRSMGTISSAAASLLQWIVSSNRSCILQVDRSRTLDVQLPTNLQPMNSATSATVAAAQAYAANDSIPQKALNDTRPAGRGRDRADQRIPGMDGWVQFKFAQGSPDKELRFTRALKEVLARKQSLGAHPTILAWHGSALENWHSIVRTGLDYRDIARGRSFGHGVYFSPHQSTSMGYACMNGAYWPNSHLKFSTCLSMNEIVNSPEDFVSRKPHYVVANNDWHQCRYLFINSSAEYPYGLPTYRMQPPSQPMTPSKSSEGRLYHDQAPSFEIRDQSNNVLNIPWTAVPQRRLDIDPKAVGLAPPMKRSNCELHDESDGELDDLIYLLSDDEMPMQDGLPAKRSRASSHDSTAPENGDERATSSDMSGIVNLSKTDFRPGTLDVASLPRLREPAWAADLATKALGRELNALRKTQTKTSLDELGWYIDFDNVENLYQWIVEFHSFDPDLPLTQDMKTAGITSIVMEVRFPRDFPFQPPFVRVIRPRFLPFLEGGGGHITAGGAICMELLTTSGWNPTSTMESVFFQVRMAMCSTEPRPGRLLSSNLPRAGGDYGIGEAIDAYMRSARAHNWKVPEDLRQTADGI